MPPDVLTRGAPSTVVLPFILPLQLMPLSECAICLRVSRKLARFTQISSPKLTTNMVEAAKARNARSRPMTKSRSNSFDLDWQSVLSDSHGGSERF